MSVQAIEIFDNERRDLVPAVFHDEMRPEQFLAAEASWGPARTAALKRMLDAGVLLAELPQHSHWNWSRKASRLNLLAYRGFGIECDGLWQGLMLTVSVGHLVRSAPDQNKPLVYIDFLESAPWNVKPLVESPKYSGVGVQLVEAAVRQSLGDGFKGRVGLHALRDAERFYEKRGMTRLGPDPAYQELAYFEFTAADATRFLERGDH
jgi:hypothetical protein